MEPVKLGPFTRIKNEAVYLMTALKTLRRLEALYKDPSHTFADTLEELARTKPDNIAIYFEDRAITYRDYNEQANKYARWALAQGIGKGDVVALLMENRPEFLIAWLGIIKVGATAALINTNQTKKPLAHSLAVSKADHLVLGAELANNYATAVDLLEQPLKVWATGGQVQGAEDLDAALAQQTGDPLPDDVREGVTTDDIALYIYTSGTTGLPKAAKISHLRLQGMMWAFSCGARATEKDRVYVVLPLYHSAGGVCAIGQALTVGGAVIIKRRFSAREFWDDVCKYEATLFQYIGELCRYLLNSPIDPKERQHHLRVASGNGLRPEIWREFQERFKIPRIMEFYGATEGNVSLFNFDGTPGAVGRIPNWAKNIMQVELVKIDLDNEVPLRDENGFCVKCETGEVGEAIGKILNDPKKPTARFEGYAGKEETEKKILRDVFEKGDAWFRTGDLLKRDKYGYFYFIDRIGDTFRWKGENVATSEVSEAISVFPGVQEANVYGVAIPGKDGRAGMASVVAEQGLDLAKFRQHLKHDLPDYAQPLFLRVQHEIEVTGTFKYRKIDLVKEGFNPAQIHQPLYFNDPDAQAFVPLDEGLYNRIVAGQIRL